MAKPWDESQPDDAATESRLALFSEAPEGSLMNRALAVLKPGYWSRLDTALIAVLAVNFLLMAIMTILPTGEPSETQPNDNQGVGTTPPVGGTPDPTPPVGGTPDPTPPVGGTPDPRPPQTPRVGTGRRVPLAVRSRLWEEARQKASKGEVDEAIALLERMLRGSGLSRVLRRTVYLQLSYYCGLAGRATEARRWLRLSKIDLEVGLVSEELWRLAEEAFQSGDFGESRRYAARFLLQESQMNDTLRQKVAVAYLRLADGYREEASKPAKNGAEEPGGGR